MRQFQKILQFEFKNYLANKIFVGVTIFLVALIAIVMYFPRITEVFQSETDASSDLDRSVMLLSGVDANQMMTVEAAFQSAFPDYEVKVSDDSLEEIEQKITSGSADCAFVLKNLTSYTYYVDNLSMYDANTVVADEVLQGLYRMNALVGTGMSADAASAILDAAIAHETETLGTDQAKNYFYTYIMIMALYMVMLLYGQMVATNVASEKSSRAMEVLITSAKPASMMFGKVLASCIAGFIQLVVIFGSAFVCFNFNKTYWTDNDVVSSIFDMPMELLVFMLVFFVLGFLIYAFLYGAIGSTVSKLEDINTAVQPITILFVIAFMVVVISLASNKVDTPLMIVCSYVPFTSPMAMFTRIAMSTVPWYEIAISIVILIASVMGVGVFSAKIYRVGVLMYGTTPKPRALLEAIRKA
jgi:ABC-2 type transport system permease protein